MNSNRRNGKPASCEPCRLNKTRCDHTYPKCNRCHQRGITDKCFYHPAPLTKRREIADDEEGRQQHEPSSNARPLKRKRPSHQRVADPQTISEWVECPPPSSQNGKFADAVAVETYLPGYLGPTSYAAILPKDDEYHEPYDREASVGSDQSDAEMTHQHPLTKAIRCQMATDILRVFRYYSTIRELVLQYCEKNQAGIVPSFIEADVVNAMESIVDKYNLTNSSPDPRLVSKVLENSSRPLHVPPTLQARQFHKLCSGDNIRFETIGWFLATAARSLWFGCAPDLFNDPDKWAHKSRMIDEIARASTTCLILCTIISPMNDVMIWMTLGNYLLTTMLCGFSGAPCWRRLGDLATSLYALGLHRESSGSNLPTWFLEIRRRVFCASYNQDKQISTFLGRPIRMSKRHTDIKIPLDLSDDEVTGNEAVLEHALGSLDENGWNTKGRYLRASWMRLRYVSSQYREEILDFALAKLDDSVERQLLDISRRIRESWDAVPQHLRYWPTCWDEGLHSSTCLMLVVVYLTHFYNEFMIQKLLDHQPLTLNTALLKVSLDLLSTAMTLGTIRDRTYDVHRDFLHTMIVFAIPAASVLATALQEQHRSGQHFPPSIKRAEIVRNLSVLISHLNAAAQVDSSGARPGEANYDICRKASKTFTRVIDTILDPKPTTDRTPTSADADLNLDIDLSLFNGAGLDAFEGMDFTVGDDGVDWAGIAQWTL